VYKIRSQEETFSEAGDDIGDLPPYSNPGSSPDKYNRQASNYSTRTRGIISLFKVPFMLGLKIDKILIRSIDRTIPSGPFTGPHLVN